MNKLENKKVIITGAAAGIGRATVKKCIENGADVIATDINKEGLVELQKEFGEDRVKIFDFDVAYFENIVKFFEELKKENIEFDCLVNNAGVYLGKSIFDYTDEEIDKVLSINLKSLIYFSREFAKDKVDTENGGVIVNVSSVSGEAGTSEVVYGATKAGVTGLTKSSAIKFSPNIRVNAIAPGVTNTALIDNIPESRMKMHDDKDLVKERIQPENIADAILFLLSNDSRHCTGMTVDVNNGYYLR